MFEIFLISFFLTFLSLFLIRPISLKYNLVDIPNSRKKHIGNIPLIGGICVFIGTIITHLYLNQSNSVLIGLLITSFLILTLGVIDDLKNIKAKRKLFWQIIIIVITVYTTDIKVENLGYLLTSSHSINLGILSLPFTVLAIVGLINAINMIDGLDGQAIILVIIAIVGLFSQNLLSVDPSFFIFLLIILGGLTAVLILNINKNHKIKIFLGDGGSLFLGFTISFALIFCSQNLKIASPSFSLWCVTLPVFDMLTVIIIRKIENRSLISANRDHIHHWLENYGISKAYILILLSTIGILCLFIGYYLEKHFTFLSFWAFITLFLGYLYLRIHFKIK